MVLARRGYGTDGILGAMAVTDTVVTITHGGITDGTIGAGAALATVTALVSDMDGAVMATDMDGAGITTFGTPQVITVGDMDMATEVMPTTVVEEDITIILPLPITPIITHCVEDPTGLQAAVILPGTEVLQLPEEILLLVVEMESQLEEPLG